jgi:hypothetical protein
MRPGGEEHLGGRREIRRQAGAPGAAMDKDEDRGRVMPAAVDVEPLDRRLAIDDALGLADALLAAWRASNCSRLAA